MIIQVQEITGNRLWQSMVARSSNNELTETPNLSDAHERQALPGVLSPLCSSISVDALPGREALQDADSRVATGWITPSRSPASEIPYG